MIWNLVGYSVAESLTSVDTPRRISILVSGLSNTSPSTPTNSPITKIKAFFFVTIFSLAIKSFKNSTPRFPGYHAVPGGSIELVAWVELCPIRGRLDDVDPNVDQSNAYRYCQETNDSQTCGGH